MLARAEAIRYVQIGNPEMIIIDDGKTKDRLAEDYERRRRQAPPANEPEAVAV